MAEIIPQQLLLADVLGYSINPERCAPSEEISTAIEEVLKTLTEQERGVIKMTYGFDGTRYSVDEIRRVWGGTRGRINQIRRGVLRKLGRKAETRQKLEGVAERPLTPEEVREQKLGEYINLLRQERWDGPKIQAYLDAMYKHGQIPPPRHVRDSVDEVSRHEDRAWALERELGLTFEEIRTYRDQHGYRTRS